MIFSKFVNCQSKPDKMDNGLALNMAKNFGHAPDHNQFAQCQNLQLCCELP